MSARRFDEHGYVILPQASLTGLAKTDAMPAALRELVHEYGFSIVDAFLTCGVSNPRHIRHLISACWMGARAPLDRPGLSGRLGTLDWLLIEAECPIPAKTLVRVLYQTGPYFIIDVEPNDIMIDASIAATGAMGLVSKREKHRGRLRAALRAGAMKLWPHLFPQQDAAA